MSWITWWHESNVLLVASTAFGLACVATFVKPIGRRLLAEMNEDPRPRRGIWVRGMQRAYIPNAAALARTRHRLFLADDGMFPSSRWPR